MTGKLLAQDLEVLDKEAKERGYFNWKKYACNCHNASNWKDFIKHLAISARQAETARCLKEAITAVDEMVKQVRRNWELHGHIFLSDTEPDGVKYLRHCLRKRFFSAGFLSADKKSAKRLSGELK